MYTLWLQHVRYVRKERCAPRRAAGAYVRVGRSARAAGSALGATGPWAPGTVNPADAALALSLVSIVIYLICSLASNIKYCFGYILLISMLVSWK